MANPMHVAVVKRGAEVIARWRLGHPDARMDISGADLVLANLFRANLTWANLKRADLSWAILTGADLIGADLIGADLSRAILMGANLTRADLFLANLTGANLAEANLAGANLAGARTLATVFARCNLADCAGLETIHHLGPSTIGVDTLAITLREAGGRFTDEQIEFFLGAGVPQTLLEYLPGILQANPLQFYSCFISYSTKDEKFAERLYEDLGTAGITRYKWNVDAVPGRDLRENIDRAIHNYDKMILVCSEEALNSGPVLREIERALQKEDRLIAAKADAEKRAHAAGEPPPYVDTDVLVPVTLDRYVFDQWEHHQKPDVVKKYIPDFSGWEKDEDKYRKELQRLIEAINQVAWPPKAPRKAKRRASA